MVKKTLILTALLVAMAASLVLTAGAQIKVGGYRTAENDNERVVAAAEFAVSNRAEKTPEQEGLVLESVDKAETQLVAGTNFRLCLTVSLDDELQQVQVVVYQNLKQVYSLSSWTVADCGETSLYDPTRENGLPLFMSFSKTNSLVVSSTRKELAY